MESGSKPEKNPLLERVGNIFYLKNLHVRNAKLSDYNLLCKRIYYALGLSRKELDSYIKQPIYPRTLINEAYSWADQNTTENIKKSTKTILEKKNELSFQKIIAYKLFLILENIYSDWDTGINKFHAMGSKFDKASVKEAYCLIVKESNFIFTNSKDIDEDQPIQLQAQLSIL